MSAVCAEDGSEPDFLGHEFVHLFDRGLTCVSEWSSTATSSTPLHLPLGEILIKPMEAGDEALARRYESALLKGEVIIPFDVDPARLYATIRKDRTIRPLDAIQLACAAQARVDLFITNDERLSAKSIHQIQFVSSLHRTFL